MITCDMSRFDEHFMRMALREAEKAASDGEVPLGCVIVRPSSSRLMTVIRRFTIRIRRWRAFSGVRTIRRRDLPMRRLMLRCWQ